MKEKLNQAISQKQTYELYTSKEEELISIQSKISEKKEKSIKYEKRQKQLEQYLHKKEIYNRQQNIISKLNNSQYSEKIAKRALSKAEELFDCIQQAENVSLEKCLDHINSEVEEYMTHFFQENNIQMSLFSYKETKDGEKKSCIDIRIIRDNESCHLDSLSGGEYDRCCFALFLAFNRVANKEMLMLDECLSSLHSEAVEEIIEAVREKCQDRLILLTLHQANTGLFDEVIDINALKNI